jgi:hypothetical protein
MIEDGKDDGGIIRQVGHVKMDLEPEEGYMLSTAKRVEVIDMNGKMYRVTVEEID